MPLVAKNVVVKKQQYKREVEPKPPPQEVNEGAVLIVNGKRKKIGKKSQYLLDMLTLED
jgi:hypothetical protein